MQSIANLRVATLLFLLTDFTFETLSQSRFYSRPGVSSNLALFAGLIANLSSISSAADCAVCM